MSQSFKREDASNDPASQFIGGRVTLADRVYNQIRRALMSGSFLPGQTLTIDQLSSLYGVSHMPVREALRRLTAVEALEITQNGATRIPQVSLTRLDDICTNRLLTEGHAVAKAAKQISPETIEKIQSVVTAHEQCRRDNKIYEMLELNQQIHFDIYRAAGSPVLTQIIENLWLRHGPYMCLLTADLNKRILPDSTIYVGPGHKMMLDALRAGDAEAAVEGLRTDIMGPQESLRELCSAYNEAQKVQS
ncbi:MAG: GntR family transcriptional regulator [Rhizobiaceae bacterium]